MKNFVLKVLLFLVFIPAISLAKVPEKFEELQYAKGRMFIRFKDSLEKSPAHIINNKGKFADAVLGGSSLDNLVERFKVAKAKSILSELNASVNPATKQADLKARESEFYKIISQKYPDRESRAPMNRKPVHLYKWYLFEYDVNQNPRAVAEAFSKDVNVDIAIPDSIVEISDTIADFSKDPLVTEQWALDKIGIKDARWTGSKKSDGQGVVVAVIDTAFDYNHEDLRNNIWINSKEDINRNGIVDNSDFNGIDDDRNGHVDDIRGWNFSDDNNDISHHAIIDSLYQNHGTSVAGVIAAEENNKGILGVAPKSKIMPLRVSSVTGKIYIYNILLAIEYAIKEGADVLNISLLLSDQVAYSLLSDYVSLAEEKGIVLVISAGNLGKDIKDIDQRVLEGAMTVAATDINDKRAVFSNAGASIDVAAPGVKIKTTSVNNTYASYDGTSLSAPYVSGLVALLIAYNKANSIKESSQDIIANIRSSADDVEAPGFDIASGFGRINAAKALDLSGSFPPKIKINNIQTYQVLDKTLGTVPVSINQDSADSYTLSYREKNDHLGAWKILPEGFGSLENKISIWDIGNLPTGEYFLLLKAKAKRAGRIVDYYDVKEVNIIKEPSFIKLNEGSSDAQRPSIDGDRVVWQDKRNGNWDIYMKDLKTNQEIAITTNSSDQLAPTISGQRIFWYDYRKDTNNPSIYYYDLTINKEFELNLNKTPIEAYHHWDTVIFPRPIIVNSNFLAWIYNRRYETASVEELYVYDFIKQQEICVKGYIGSGCLLETDSFLSDIYNLSIHKNELVFNFEYVDTPTGTYSYDHISKTVQRLSPFGLRTSKIIKSESWASSIDWEGLLFLRNVNEENRTSIQVSKFSLDYDSRRSLNSGLLAWTNKSRDYSNKDIYIYDAVHQNMLFDNQLTYNTSDADWPAVTKTKDRARVVWQDNRSGHYDIYMYEYPIINGESIIWRNLEGVVVNDGDLKKNASTRWGNAGASSVQIIPGDGKVEFTSGTSGTASIVMVGLSNVDRDVNYATIQYGLYLYQGELRVYENGFFISSGTNWIYDANDKFSVERIGATVYYRKNGVVLYASSVPSSGALIADVSMYNFGATLGDAKITGGVTLETVNLQTVNWFNVVGSSVSGGSLTKTALTAWGNAGASSLQTIPKDGGIEFNSGSAGMGTIAMVGLSSTDKDANYTTIQYGLYLYQGRVRVHENGTYKGDFGTFDAYNDKFLVERNGTTVSYKKNGIVFYVSNIVSIGSLVADSSIYNNGGTIGDAKILIK